MRQDGWEHFEHDADIGLRAIAATREGLFEVMGQALTAIITEPAAVRSVETVSISCEAPDDALLLVDWLNTLIFEMATRRMLFGSWHVELSTQKLRGQVQGEVVDRLRHQPVVEVKGATYTELSVAQDSEGSWHGQCVVDV
jgi:tRNA nucleotidyltransferase (CCA-adding enzyme)